MDNKKEDEQNPNNNNNINHNNTLLADYINGLSLSSPRHQSTNDDYSVLRRRVQSAAQGQNGNFHNCVLPPGFDDQDEIGSGFGTISGRNGFLGFGPSLDEKSFLGPDRMFVANGLTGAQLLSRPGSGCRDLPAELGQNGNFQNGVLCPGLDSAYDDQDKSFRQNGFPGRPDVAFGPGLDKNGFFGLDRVNVANGLSGAQLSSRPSSGYRDLPAELGQNGVLCPGLDSAAYDDQDELKSNFDTISRENGFLGRADVPFGSGLDQKSFLGPDRMPNGPSGAHKLATQKGFPGVPFGPGLDKKGFFGLDRVNVANGPSEAQLLSNPGSGSRNRPAELGQNGNLHNGVLPVKLDSAYDQDNLKSCYNMISGQNGFPGRPDVPFGPSLDKKGFFGPNPMHAANGPNGAQLSSRPGPEYRDFPAQWGQNGNFHNAVLPSGCDSAYDDQDNFKSSYNMISGQNGLAQEGFFGPNPMHAANGPSGAQLPSRSDHRGQNGNLHRSGLPCEFVSTYDDQGNLKSYRKMISRQNGVPDPMYEADGLSGAQFLPRLGPEYRNSNLQRGILPQVFDSAYDDHDNLKSYYYNNMINRQNRLSGRPEGSFVPSLAQNGLFGPNPMHVLNGPSGAQLSSRLGLDYRNQTAQWGQNGNLDVGFLPYDQPGSTYSNPINRQNRLTGRPGSVYNSNNLVNGSSFLRGDSFGPSLDQGGLFGSDSMYVPNGPNLWPNLGMNPPVQHRPLHNKNGLGRGRTVHAERSNWPGIDYSKHQINDFRGNIKAMAKNRGCSGFLRQKIEDGAEEDLKLIFDEVKDDVASLMVNYFGSTVVQAFFEVCRPEQISYMLRSLLQFKFKFVEICCDHHGSIAMTRLLENISTSDQRTSFISALSGVVLILSKDHNGLQAVKYCLDHFPENVDALINEIVDDCFAMATHKSGCCVLQPCLSRAAGETMERLIDELAPNAVFLSDHVYGNYVVQYILTLENPSITRNILGHLAGNYASLSMNRCGSNVVEKCLMFAREDEASEIIIEIMDSDNFDMLLKHPFGNYVIQKALEVSQKMEKREIQGRLENRIMKFNVSQSLESHPYGNRVLSKIKHLPRRF